MSSAAWVCSACCAWLVNGDLSGEDEQMADIVLGAEAYAELGFRLSPDFDGDTGEGLRDFDRGHCECCGSWLGGSRFRFSVWEVEAPTPKPVGCAPCDGPGCKWCGGSGWLVPTSGPDGFGWVGLAPGGAV